MSDAAVRYGIEIEYLTKGNLFAGLEGGRALGSVRDLERKMSGSLARVGDGFASGFGRAVEGVSSTLYDGVVSAAKYAGVAAAGAIGFALKDGIRFSDYIEQSTIGIASVRTMLGGEHFDAAERAAAASVERMRVLAKDLPGEMKDVVGSFAYIQSATIGLGIKDTRAESLAAHGVAAAAAIGVNQATFGHELAAMIEGRARSAMPAVAKLGFVAKELNAMDPLKRFAMIEDRIHKLGPAIERYKTSWAGLTSAGRDSMRQTARVFASPIFESLKTEMGRGLEWFGKNEDAVNAWATRLGVQVDYAFHRGLDAVKYWLPIVHTFGENLYESVAGAFRRVEPIIGRLAAGAERFMLDPDAPSRLAHGAALLGGARLGVGAANLLGPALGAELGPALLGLAPLAIAAAGAVHAYTDETSYAHDAVVRGVDDIRSRVGPTFEHLTAAAARLEGPAVILADRLGTVLVQSLEASALVIEKGTWLFDQWTGALEKAYGAIKPFLDKVYGPTLNRESDVISVNREPLQIMSLHSMNTTADEIDRSLKKVHAAPNHTTNVHNHFKVDLHTGADPNRVAVVLKDLQKQMVRNPLSSPHDVNRTLRAGYR